MRRFLLSMFDEVHEWVGWFGMACILIGYAGVSTHWLLPETLSYQSINLVGAIALLYSAAKTRSYPVVALNVAWLAIAGSAIYTIFLG